MIQALRVTVGEHVGCHSVKPGKQINHFFGAHGGTGQGMPAFQ